MIEDYTKRKIPRRYFIIVFFTIAILVGLVVYVMQKRTSTSLDYLNKKIMPPEYENPEYCQEDSDCMIFHEVCGAKAVNKYNFDEKLDEQNLKQRTLVEMDCTETDFVNVRCENSICVGE